MVERLGDRIRKARRRCGLSGAELARRIDVARQHLHAVETNRIGDPGVLLVARVAEVLNVSADYLLSGRLEPRRRWQSLMRAIVSPPLRPWLAPNPQRQYADATTASGRSILHFRTLGESMDPLDDRLTILERAQLLHDATLRRHGDMLARHGGVSRPLGIYHLC